MKLFLAVPRQSTQTGSQSVIRPTRTRQWISRLPLLDTWESLSRIHEALRESNRTVLKTAQRLKLLDIYRPPVRVIRGQVESRLSRGAAPLADEDLALAGLFRDTCVEMAYGYKTIVLDIARSRKRRQLDDMRLSMARAIFYLEQTIFACAMFHQAPPVGVWQEIHAIYYYTRKLGMSDEPIKAPVLKGRASITISLVYRRAVLFGLADPFHQSVPMLIRILDFLKEHVDSTQIESYSRPRTRHCQFIIDPHSDSPARAYVKDTKQKPPRDALLLNTIDMTRRAHELLKRLESVREDDVELDNEFQNRIGGILLREVVHCWGLTAQREAERTTRNRQHVDLVSGMEKVIYVLNGESAFKPASMDHALRDPSANILAIPSAADTATGEFEPLAGLAMDHAETGLRISIPYARAGIGTFQIGGIVATRCWDEPWTAGSIRWIRCIDASIQMGIRKFPPGFAPAAIKPVSTEYEVPFKGGLMSKASHAPQVSVQLVTPAGLYQRQRNLFVDEGETLLMVRTGKLIEQSQVLEWFECENLNL